MTQMEQFQAALWAWFLDEARADVLGSYGEDYAATEHLRTCGVDLSASGLPDFDVYDSWGGSLAGNETVRGIVARRVSCRCGQVTGATVATDESMPLTQIVRGVIAQTPTASPAPAPEG